MVGRGALPAAYAGERFGTAEEAWFWTCDVLAARRQGHQRSGALVRRMCEPDDILLCLERLLTTGRLSQDHARVMGRWGFCGIRPSRRGHEAEAARLWSEAMGIVTVALASKNILMDAI